MTDNYMTYLKKALEERQEKLEEKYGHKRYGPLTTRDVQLNLVASLDDFYQAYLGRAETGERTAYIKAIEALTSVLGYLEHEDLWPQTEHGEPGAPIQWLDDLATQLRDLDAGI